MNSKRPFRFQNWYLPEKIKAVEDMIEALRKKRGLLVEKNNMQQMSESDIEEYFQELGCIDSFMWKLKNDCIILKKQQEESEVEWGN